MAIEIVDFPINSMVIFQFAMLNYQRVCIIIYGWIWLYLDNMVIILVSNMVIDCICIYIYIYMYMYNCICSLSKDSDMDQGSATVAKDSFRVRHFTPCNNSRSHVALSCPGSMAEMEIPSPKWWFTAGKNGIPSGNCQQFANLKIVISSGFTHWTWWFSIVALVYQRVYHHVVGYEISI